MSQLEKTRPITEAELYTLQKGLQKIYETTSTPSSIIEDMLRTIIIVGRRPIK